MAWGQAETGLELIGHGQGDGDAGAFQHLDHAEEPHGVAALYLVVEEGHHQLDGQLGLAVAHRLGIAATGADVAQDPLLMAVLLVDVLGDGAAHPLILLTQLAAGGHQERYRVAHVIEGLGEEAQVDVAGDLPCGTPL